MNTTIAGLAIPDSDLCHVQWRSLAWILEHGPLNESNAIDYFALSPFYDRKSTNQVLRMQSMFSGQPKMDPASEQEALRRFVGIEYALVLSRPEPDREGGLFVIEKRDRKSYDESPSLYSTLSARVLTSLSALKELLELARQHKPIYDPRQSYAWKIKEKPESTATTSDTLDKPTGVQPLTESSKEAEPTSTHQESDEKMDIDMTAPEGNDDESPAKTTDTKKDPRTHPSSPIRSYSQTIPSSLVLVQQDQTILPWISSTNFIHSIFYQPPARLDSSQDGLIKSGSVAGKTPAKSGGAGTGNKKQKRAA
ncbi:hypothetical protein PSHT_02935 [Puccinia striiformis]|uniref:Mediator of RNA polymerase II transcription subunit 6 n=1 Tax=Puccinia striiformis TaxID=27350 RepID=A0A2S4WGV8_9BASI|nr:hypothetical protein PSHT_02935 [Puccinia striiformis]